MPVRASGDSALRSSSAMRISSLPVERIGSGGDESKSLRRGTVELMTDGGARTFGEPFGIAIKACLEARLSVHRRKQAEIRFREDQHGPARG